MIVGQSALVTDPGHGGVDAWDRWVTELEDHPLDEFEYAELLSSRDRLVDQLEIAGVERLWTLADAIDARFVEITTVDEMTADAAHWWRARVPKDPDALRYLRGDY